MNNADAICKSLKKNPQEWSVTPFRLTHKATGVEIWIGNGRMFLTTGSGSKIPVYLSLFGKFKVWKSYKAWIADHVADQLGVKNLVKGEI